MTVNRAGLFLPATATLVHKHPMTFPLMPDPAAEREREQARRNPDQDTLELAAAGAAWTLGPDHSATKALTKASITMDRVSTCGTRGWRSGRYARTSARRSPRRRKAEAGFFYPVENDWGHCMTGPILRCRAVASTGHPENRGHHESL
jgi:hypothetical protein